MKILRRFLIIYILFWALILYINPFSHDFQKEAIMENVEEEMKETMGVLVKSFNKYVIQEDYLETKEGFLGEKFIFLNISIGDPLEKVIETLGEPQRKDVSKYGFQWYIYNKDYTKYLQVGVKDGKVVGLYSNSPIWQSQSGLQIGSEKEKVKEILGEPLEYIKKGNTLYYLNSPEENSTYLISDYYATVFYDLHDNCRVASLQLIDRTIEESLQGFYGELSEELKKSFEKQIFDLANATRVRFGKPSFQWDDKAALAGRKHSADMANRKFFNHENPDGEGPSHRIEKEGISWRRSGENIAAGQTSAIFAHENWMNSIGHRENLLGDFIRLGVGVYFGGDYHIYYTQNFYTP